MTALRFLLMRVALRKESVDRNDVVRPAIDVFLASLSARRAWIEMRLADMSAAWNRLSLSARRAWIEIAAIRLAVLSYYRRSPQGERG